MKLEEALPAGRQAPGDNAGKRYSIIKVATNLRLGYFALTNP
ncbi:MAG: hypothetical protein AAB568_02280 [Patescibacteria group bacterium]